MKASSQTAAPKKVLLEDLLVHAAWVNGLALRLVGDAAAAEDLVQETWVAALQTPPKRSENLRGWLGSVLRNSFRQRHRGAARRARREEVVATERGLEASPDELVERVETQRRVAALVLELEEPLRQTLVLHFYDGLSATQIARQLGLAESTVRSRVTRGLEVLREKLDDDYEGRHAWLALLTPLARRHVPVAEASSVGLSALLNGLLAMHLGWKLSIASVALVLLTVFSPIGQLGLQFVRGPQLIELEPLATTFRPVEVELASAGEDSARESASPAPLSASPGATLDAVDSGVSLRVLDPEGRPVSGAQVFLRMDRHKRGETNVAGSLTLALDGDLSSKYSYEIVIDDPRFLREQVEFMFSPGDVVALGDVRLQACGAIEGVVIDARGEPVSGARIGLGEIERDRSWLERECVDRTAAPQYIGEDRTDEQGRFYLARQPVGSHLVWAGIEGQLASYVQPVEVRAQQVSEGVEVQLGVYDPAQFISGVVLDPAGQPVPRAELHIEYRSWSRSGSHSLHADNEGRFLLSYAYEVPRTIRASDRDGSYGSAVATGVEGGEEHLVLQLTEPQWMEVEVRGPSGLLDGPGVAVFDTERRRVLVGWDGVQVTDGVARFILPDEAFLIEVECAGHDEQLVGPFEGRSAPARITVSLNSLPGICGSVTAQGEPLAGAHLELREVARRFTERNGFPIRVRDFIESHGESDSQGEFCLTLREAGSFYLRVSAEGFAPSELGPFELDPQRGLDGLEVALGAGGAIEGRLLVASGESPAGKIVAISRGDAHAVTQRVRADGTYRFEHLIPGAWLVVEHDRPINDSESSSSSDMREFSEAVISSNCEVVEGQTTRFNLDLASAASEVALDGLLVLDGVACRGWEARLVPAGRMISSIDQVKVNTDSSDGSFRLVAPRAGRYRLLLQPSDDSGRIFSSTLELYPGVTTWSHSFATGTLSVRNPEPLGELGIPRDFFLISVEGVNVLAPVSTSQATTAGLPVGAGRITRFTPEELGTLTEFPTDHPALVEVRLQAGETSVVELP